MTFPILTVQQGKFVYQGMRGLAFQLLHQLAYSKTWRSRNEKMDMVRGYMPLEYFHLMFLTDAAYQRPGPLGDVAWQNLFPVLGYPDQMKVTGENTMGTFAIVAHAHRLQKKCWNRHLKVGVLPLPEWDNKIYIELQQICLSEYYMNIKFFKFMKFGWA